ncbi:hypothetical protein R0131_15755 [Clostridium sp. AL.422]|uniref:DUF3592 domain-containing protein n=1 Tax=Clostridium TaxID=1485 RepID=UPI00293DAB75|nr:MULTISPECIES: DUF3592 domain-containing protein [unclassified Clostridium]MDV4152281.1 hypothetical protein [Clostridium sp. AL.422]
MKTSILFFLIFFIEGIIFLILTLFFKNRDKNILERANQIVIGKVTKYTLLGNKGVYYPIVEYIVNDVTYNQRLKYSWIITKSSSFKNINPEIENNFLDTNLVISKNAHVSRNILIDKFPIGSELAVYYNPSNPKESYVLRFTKNPCIKIFLIVSILFISLSFIGLVLLPNNLISLK